MKVQGFFKWFPILIHLLAASSLTLSDYFFGMLLTQIFKLRNLAMSVNNLSLCLKSPIATRADGRYISNDAGVIEVMLLKRYSALLEIHGSLNPTHTELYVKISRLLV